MWPAVSFIWPESSVAAVCLQFESMTKKYAGTLGHQQWYESNSKNTS